MGVRKKGRRKISIGQADYVWYVAENDDGPGHVLHIVSEDKSFLVLYPLVDLPESEQYLVVVGSRFSGADTGGCWRRFHCPKVDNEGVITPSGIVELVNWALLEKEDLREYKFVGLPTGV